MQSMLNELLSCPRTYSWPEESEVRETEYSEYIDEDRFKMDKAKKKTIKRKGGCLDIVINIYSKKPFVYYSSSN